MLALLLMTLWWHRGSAAEGYVKHEHGADLVGAGNLVTSCICFACQSPKQEPVLTHRHSTGLVDDVVPRREKITVSKESVVLSQPLPPLPCVVRTFARDDSPSKPTVFKLECQTT